MRGKLIDGKLKRGQSAAGAAVLLAIIAGFIVMFIILIPPQERAKLLDGDNETVVSNKNIDIAVPIKNLLTVSPGRIDYLAQKEIEHPLPVINIFTRTEAKVLAEKNFAYAKKGVFSEETSELSFVVPDLKNTETFLLSFNVDGSAEGKLIIKLNDEDIFSAEVKDGDAKVVKIPKNLIKEMNSFTFSISSPGLAFWATNDVSLKEIKVVADVTSVEAQSSKNIFLISETEMKNLKKVVLKFQPNCKFNEVGKLLITINEKTIYSGVPDCDLAMVPIEFSSDSIYQGENQIVFYTEKGTYLLSHVVIESELNEVDFPAYYFELSYEDYNDVKDDKKRARLTMNFVDVVASKFGEIVFNGNVRYFDTKEVSYTLDLSGDVVQGANSLKIKPKKTLDVREVKIDLIK
ncbi:MAG: hypothetical protein ABH824_00925 [Nanoarchaeota archaeon]|nr:hypothetical protein [Nanoarchaeota archaeon]MBU1632348.1 hypothetical protein [Nanoarchaeota archaeon]